MAAVLEMAAVPEAELAPEAVSAPGTGIASGTVFASGTGLISGSVFDPETVSVLSVPGAAVASETGLAAGTVLDSEAWLASGRVFVPEAGLAAETVFASRTVILPETAAAPETALFAEGSFVPDTVVLPEETFASEGAVSSETALLTETLSGGNTVPEGNAGDALSAGSSGLTGETGLARGGMTVSGETGDSAARTEKLEAVWPFAGPEAEAQVSSEQASSQVSSEQISQVSSEQTSQTSSEQVPLESVLRVSSPEQSGAAPLAVGPEAAAETEGSEAAEFTRGAQDGNQGIFTEPPVNPQGQSQQGQSGGGSTFKRQSSQASQTSQTSQQSALLQMLSQPGQRFFVSSPVNGSSPGAFAMDMPEVVLQSFRSFENAGGAREMVIQLTPESLGQLTVKLVSQDGLLAIRILAQSPMTQRVLESGIAGLKQALDQQGIRYQRIEVELDGRQMGHHQSGEEQASAWANKQNQWAYDQQRFQGSRFYDAAEDRMALTGEIPGEVPGAVSDESEEVYSGQINYVV
jgi:flagellar hook-length control protein FliK